MRVVQPKRELKQSFTTDPNVPSFICSGGIDPTIIAVGSEKDAEELVRRVNAIVARRSLVPPKLKEES